MRIRAWLGRIFDPPVTQRHFDRAMAEQTEAIRELGDKVEKGHNRVVAALEAGHAEILALVSEMQQAVSEVSDDVRVHDEARSSDAVGSAPREDDPD